MDESAVQNVIVFGESGVGKSSIINLIVGSQVAKTSSDAHACTVRTQFYDVIINGNKYRLWDTPGLNGGTLGLFRAAIAERNLKMFLRKVLRKNEPTLLLYCVRASRATRALVSHYQSVCLATDGSAVPMVIIVTGLENSRGDMETWWGKNVAALSNHGMEFVDHACITSIDDDIRDSALTRTRRIYSQDIVRNLIFRNCAPRQQDENAPQYQTQVAGKLSGMKGWTWIVWTYLVSALLMN